MKKALFVLVLVVLFQACDSSSLKDAIDLAQGVPRKDINRSLLGINAFFNDGRFGSTSQQFSEISNTLGIKHVRILFHADDGVSRSKGGALNFSFIDGIINNAPDGVDVLIILTGIPRWMESAGNWDGGDLARTYAEDFCRPLFNHYADNSKVIGFQIWNEPNMARSDNSVMGFADPAKYTALLGYCYSIAKDISPSKLILNAATTAINQNYPETRDYNRAMRDAGATNFVDVWAAHYYGKQYENVIRDGGVADFLNGLDKPIWITESGAQGVNEQLAYGEEVWPFLEDKIENLQRIYIYQFTEASGPDSTYGLKNVSSDMPVSDLYVHLRNN